jgi:hypothetical protein
LPARQIFFDDLFQEIKGLFFFFFDLVICAKFTYGAAPNLITAFCQGPAAASQALTPLLPNSRLPIRTILLPSSTAIYNRRSCPSKECPHPENIGQKAFPLTPRNSLRTTGSSVLEPSPSIPSPEHAKRRQKFARASHHRRYHVRQFNSAGHRTQTSFLPGQYAPATGHPHPTLQPRLPIDLF